MPRTCPVFLFALLIVWAGTATAAEVELPPSDKEPLLRVEAGGPVAFVTAMAFSPDGKTLYAGGWDKVVRVWTQNDKGVFQLSSSSYRVPVGPGLYGAINALALSPDGNWLAVAGNGMARQIAGFQQLGFIVPSFGVRDPAMLRDVGTIYLFNTRDRGVRMLRGHQGHVTALTFGPPRGKDIPPLLSVAVEEKEGDAIEKRLTARIWDPNKEKSIAELPGLPCKALNGWMLPGAALWQNEAGDGALRAALALYDGKLRLWQPGREQVRLREVNDVNKNLTVAHLGRGRLLTAGFDAEANQWLLARWRVPAEGKPKRERTGVLRPAFPRALALLSRQADGVADLAAILALVPGQKDAPHQYRLRLADLNDDRFHVVTDIRLWRDPENRQPPLATSLRGKHLAVANNADHTIRIYAVRDLLGVKEPVPQILRTNAIFFRQASFVRRGKDLGLRLQRDRGGDWIFDAGKRRLTDDLTDWQPANPKAGVWKAMHTRDAQTIIVSEREVDKAKITIPEKEIATAYTLLPPGESVKLPLLAVASHENGQPLLTIYNAKSGEPVRKFTGHSERLRSLAFAPDGRLLVSTADDGTVCVWSLTDLNTIVDKHGGLPGVTVGPADKGTKGVKVLEVKPGSPVHDKLKRGDVVSGLVQKGELQRIDSPRGFYEALYQFRPGTEISLRRGDPKEDVSFRVGQGIDERKPLFSLFVIDVTAGGTPALPERGRPARKPENCEWIGWSPIGPYEASSPRAEKYLGWHFNTGEAKAPTRFVEAGQYRKFYYRANLLDQLLQRGALGRVEAPRLPPPVLGLWVADADRPPPQREQETVIVRRPNLDLTVAVFERPLSSLSALTWQLDNRAAGDLDLDQLGDASFQVPVKLARGENRFAVTARTRDGSAPPTRKTLILRYQPLPPEVAIKDAGQQRLARQADFTLEASIKPKVSGENVRVTIRHRHDEGEEKRPTQTLAARDVVEGAALPIRHSLKLRPGNNEIEVSALNGGAPADAQGQETETKKLSIFYYFKAKPPVIAFRQVVPVGDKETALPVDLSQPAIVHRRVVKIIGQITAEDEPLIEAQWDRGKATTAARLDGFEAGKRKEFAFEQRVILEPGSQTIRLRAKTKNSETVERNLELTFQPPVPVVSRLTAPRDGQVLEGDADEKTVRIRGEVRFPSAAYDYKPIIRVNDKPAVPPPVLDEKTGTLSGSVVLGPGENRIRVEIRNKWGASSSSEVVLVRYVRPPVFAGALTHKAEPGTALVNLTVPVLSPAPLERDSVRIDVNGNESTPKEVRIEKGAANRWTVHLLRVPLDAGSREQKIAVQLANSEAACRAPAAVTIRSEMLLQPPEAEFLEPRQDGRVSTSTTLIRFRIRSEGKLEAVRLLRPGRPPQSIELGSPRRVGGQYELTATAKVELEPGTNQMSLDAVSVSGRLRDSPRLVLSYVPPPLRIAMESLTELGADAAPANPPLGQEGDRHFPKAASGHVALHGRVFWTGEGEIKDSVLLQVFVNGFQQQPYPVHRKGDTAETRFQIPLLLNRPTGNRINLVAYRQYVESPTVVVDCDEPITAQRLYVLALSPYSRPEEVTARLEQALHDLEQRRKGRPPVFADVKYLPPLTGDDVKPDRLARWTSWFSRQMVLHQAQMLRSRTGADKHKNAPMNDILLIYYEGREKIDDTGHYFETYSPSGKNAFAMPCAKLASYLETVPGAHVLLLDVDRSAQARQDRSSDTIAGWKDKYPEAHSHVVVMRCARRNEPGRRSSVRLIPVLRQQIPQAARLSDLMDLIEKALFKSNDRDLLIFTKYLPPELANLKFGSSLP